MTELLSSAQARAVIVSNADFVYRLGPDGSSGIYDFITAYTFLIRHQTPPPSGVFIV